MFKRSDSELLQDDSQACHNQRCFLFGAKKKDACWTSRWLSLECFRTTRKGAAANFQNLDNGKKKLLLWHENYLCGFDVQHSSLAGQNWSSSIRGINSTNMLEHCIVATCSGIVSCWVLPRKCLLLPINTRSKVGPVWHDVFTLEQDTTMVILATSYGCCWRWGAVVNAAAKAGVAFTSMFWNCQWSSSGRSISARCLTLIYISRYSNTLSG